MSGLADLPLDIFREILLRSPAESLFRLRAVCKRWRTVIDDPNFVRAHTFDQLSSSSSSLTLVIRNSLGPFLPFPDQLHTFDLDAVNLSESPQAIPSLRVQPIHGYSLNLSHNESYSLHFRFLVSTCNGLILVAPPSYQFEIWNLSTHERLQLPPFTHMENGPLLTGLGYDRAAQDFKAVALHSRQTHVYSLRRDKWRMIGVCLGSDEDDEWAAEKNGLFLGGALHWLFLNKIIVLDLGTEKQSHIHLNASQKSVCLKHIDVLGGCLVLSYFSDDSQSFHVWVNTKENNEPWTKLFSINRVDLTDVCVTCIRPGVHLTYLRPVAYMKDKNHVFMRDGESGFFLFNVKRGCMKRFHIYGLDGNLHAQIIPRTIFRLRDHCCATSSIIPLCRPRQKVRATLTIHSQRY